MGLVPYLIDGYKFDLRVYALITQCDPLHVYVYQEGIARFATEPYVPPNETNQSNLCMHLTNYAVNKKSKHFLDGGKEEGSKRSMTWVWKYLDAQGLDGQGVWQKIKDIIVKSVLIVAPEIKRLIRRCFPHMQESVCFELLGFDILLDRKLTPYVLEINHSPSLSCDTSLDHALKQTMLEELFQVLHLDSLNPQKWRHQERVEAQQRLYPTSSMASPPFSGASTSSLHPPSLPTPPTVSFELIYPPTSPSLLHQYSLFLNHAEHLARVPDTLASSHRKQTRPSPSVLKPRLPPLPFMDPSAGPNSSEVDLKKKPSSTHVVTKKSGSCPSVSSNLTSTSTHAATHPLKVERKVFQLHVPACETWL
ncbi:hypothetical protein HMI54_012564 [Coelomomyces lativittatus]|nr:hypothetical protein HMI54_012564 [Coelomomyces lativittatus]